VCEIVFLVDQPLIKSEDYNRIIRVFEEKVPGDPKAIIRPSFEGKKGNQVIFSTHYKQAILQHQQPEGCREIVQDHQKHVAFAALTTPAILNDIDHPEDYEELINTKKPPLN